MSQPLTSNPQPKPYNRFFNVSPSFTIMLSKAFPDIFEEHMQMRSDFIYEKIKINIEKGMEQGMYKKDISSEMIARMYIAKLNDLLLQRYSII